MPAVEILGKHVTFEAATAVEPGALLSVTLDQNQALEISVESCRDMGNGNYLVVARSPEALHPTSPFQAVLGQRRHLRAKQRLRVMSADLPEYQALTIDCSASGLQLETAEPIERGEILRLQIGLPNLGADVEAQVEVVWCQAWDEKYRVGCQIIDAPSEFLHSVGQMLQVGLPPTPKRPLRNRRQSPGLPLRPPAPVMTDEEQAPLDAHLQAYAVDGSSIVLMLHLQDGEIREIKFDRVKSLRDLRGHRGTHIGFLSCQNLPGGATRVRFLSPNRDKVLEIVTRTA